MCSLLDQAALERVSGLDASRRDPGFAGWQCFWGGNPALPNEPWASVEVSRVSPLRGGPVQIGGRSALVTAGGSGNLPGGLCEVQLVHRSYQDASGEQRVEVLDFWVYLGAQQSTDAACRSATALAEVAAAKLPPA